MKKISLFLCVILLICQFSISASAHAGSTDEDGGHTDSSTGDYHYHHGFPAHAHFDIDGDGDIDCPYDFVDQTNHNSGTNSSSYSDGYSNGREDGYSDGYADGYKKGKIDGEKDGYASGYHNGETDALKQADTEYEEEIKRVKNLSIFKTFFWCSSLWLIVTICLSQKDRKSQRQLIKNHDAKVKELSESHAAEIKRQQSLSMSFVRKAMEWERRYKHEKRNVELLTAQVNADALIADLPEDIALEPFFTPIKGESTKDYPYGDFTIFMTRHGRKYHCSHDCVDSANPYHFFDLPKGIQPCEKCVPRDMYPQPLPEWAVQIRKE